MPKVPYKGLPTETPNPIPQNRQSAAGASPDAFGAAQARGLGDMARATSVVANEAYKIALDVRERDQSRMLLDADTAWQSYVRETLVTGKDGKSGFYQEKGVNAIKRTQETVDGMNKTRQKMSENIQDPKVRAAFDKASMSDLNNHLGKIATHSITERREAETASRQAGILEARQRAEAFATQPDEVAMALDLAESLTRDQAEADGLDELATLHLVEKVRSEINAAAISNVARNDAELATEMFLKVADTMDGDVASKLATELQAQNMAERSQGLAEKAMSMFPGDIKAQREWTRANASGELEDDTIKRLNAYETEEYTDLNRQLILASKTNALLETAERRRIAAEKAATDEAWKEVVSHANNGGSVATWMRQNPDKAGLVTTKTNFDSLYKMEANAIEGNVYAKVTDIQTYGELDAMTPEELAKVNVADYQKVLTQEDYRRMEAKKKTAEASMNHLHGPLFNAGARALTKFGPSWMNSPAKMTPTQQGYRAAMTQGMNEWLTQQVNEGKTPSQTDIDEKARELSREVVQPGKKGIIWDGPSKTMPAAAASKNLTPEQKDTLRIPIKKLNDVQINHVRNVIANGGFVYSDDLAERVAAAIAMRDEGLLNKVLATAAKSKE